MPEPRWLVMLDRLGIEGLTSTSNRPRLSVSARVVLGVGLSTLVAVGCGRSPMRSAAAHGPGARAAQTPSIDPRTAESVLFGANGTNAAACGRLIDAPRRILCFIEHRYRADPAAGRLARVFYERTGGIAGVATERDLEPDRLRGIVHIVPELPVGRFRKHLEWLVGANLAIDDFARAITARAGRPIAFRNRPILVRFFRSVGRTTPAAIASNWTLSYNVVGSINTSAALVRETVFHEIFHFNDGGHDGWSKRTLTGLFQTIRDRCSQPGARVPSTACLARYTPGSTIVRQGTYYAFQPGGGVHEYAAELAARYYTETQGALAGRPLRAAEAFKCLAPENAVAWTALAREFFGGVDVLPPCR